MTDDKDIVTQARERARDGAAYWQDNWEEAEADLEFLSGDQWPEGVRNERELEQRPCLVNNVLPTFVDQVLGDQRQNRPAIKVSPVDMVRVQPSENTKPENLKISNTAGSTDYELAEAFTGLIKNIEYNCDAETSYDIAFQSAVESGIGYLRVRSDYIHDETFEQDLIIDHIENQFSVTMDPNAKERDYSDMMWCLIDQNMNKEEFRELYPDASTDPVSDKTDDFSSWYAENTVRVSEYFTRECVEKEVVLLSDGRSMYRDEVESVLDELAASGIEEVDTRKVKTHIVVWRKITGMDVLEGPIELTCSSIPVVPVWGKSITIKKKTMFRSIIRYSKDAQRMANYWDSAATETVALAPKAPFVGTPEQIEGYEEDWQTANTNNLSMLAYNAQYQGDQGPRRQQPAPVPSAEITLGMQSSDKIKSTLGMFDASIGNSGNETSGRAIIARQRQGDRGSFAFIDNLSKSIRRVGKILVEMIPQVYDTERVVRLKFPDDTEDFVKLNQQVFDEQTKEWVTIHDLNVSKYDVVVTTGPAYSTQRQEAAEQMMQFSQANPQAAAAITDLIALNMDWPGADKIAERLKKTMPPELMTADEQEKLKEDMPEPPPPPPPTPEQQVQMMELEAKKAEAEADMAKAQATAEKAQSDIVIQKMKTEEAAANAQAQQQPVVDSNIIKEHVADALAEYIKSNQA